MECKNIATRENYWHRLVSNRADKPRLNDLQNHIQNSQNIEAFLETALNPEQWQEFRAKWGSLMTQNPQIFQEYMEAMSNTLTEHYGERSVEFLYKTIMKVTEGISAEDMIKIYNNPKTLEEGGFQSLINNQTLDVIENSKMDFVRGAIERFKQIDAHILEFDSPLREALQRYSENLENICDLINREYNEIDPGERARLLKEITEKIWMLRKFTVEIYTIAREMYPTNTEADGQRRGEMFNVFAFLSEVLITTGQSNPDCLAVIGEYAGAVSNMILSDPFAAAYMSASAKNIFYTVILPVAAAYELNTNPQWQPVLISLENQYVAEHSTDVVLFDFIEKLSSKIAEFIREKNLHDEQDAARLEKKREEEKEILNMNTAIEQYLASIGLSIENIAAVAMERIRQQVA